MTARILDGKKVALKILSQLKKETAKLKKEKYYSFFAYYSNRC